MRVAKPSFSREVEIRAAVLRSSSKIRIGAVIFATLVGTLWRMNSYDRSRRSSAFLLTVDGVAKSPPYGVMAFFQDLDIPYICLRP
jgi:hypothetical protein